MPHLFEPLTLRGVEFRNRIMVSPMCQYSAGEDGRATDWHLVHLGSRAAGGAGAVCVEATSVESRGRLSTGDTGLWSDDQIEPLARIVRFCQGQGARVGIQLAHAGRKAWSDQKGHGLEHLVGPSHVPFGEGWAVPQTLNRKQIGEVAVAFRESARRALDAGFDFIELHAAHGYLIHQFLSPLSNEREDEYGGAGGNTFRFLHEVIGGVRQVWPVDRPLFVRISATDWVPGSWDLDDSVELAKTLEARGVDLIDCSSAGSSPSQQVVLGPGYQVPFAERIRREAGIRTGAVGLIEEPEMADEIIRSGRADLVIMGRALLRHPTWPLEAARALGHDVPWPTQYRRAKR